MARIVNLRMPDAAKLFDMSPEETARFVSELADRALEMMPAEVQPVGVSAVSLDALRPGSTTGGGVWGEWTRACCDRRGRIPEFEEPVIEQFEPAGSTVHQDARGQHVESVFRTVELANPLMHAVPELNAE